MLICSGVIQDSRVDVHTDTTSDEVMVDPDALQQVLVNLVQNSVDAMTEAPFRTISVRTRVVHDWVHLNVTDTGQGMCPDTLARLFDRGFSTKGDSRGLGMTSCRRLVEDMAGRLVANSDGIGRGATVELVLPLAR